MEVIKTFVPNSPFAQLLGISIEDISQDRAVLAMPYKAELATMGEMVHGGAIATLADTAGMVASWADGEVPERLAGSTVSFALDFLAPANGSALRAEANVIRRGKRLCRCEITVVDETGTIVAMSLLTYNFA
jgi:uncharacterized protein (TIGR00369 family)